MPPTHLTCWIVTEGMAGTENQCIGVAEALGAHTIIKRIGLREPWRTLSPLLGFECARSFTGDPLLPDSGADWPDVVLASGRKAIAAARFIKRASKGRSFTVFIQDPRTNPRHFDLVAVPAHDPTRGPNVIVTIGAPNRITAARLDDARAQWASRFAALPSPRVAVLIGGNSKAYKMQANVMRDLAGHLRALNANGYGLMVTASRRTGAENEAILRDALKDTDAFLWDGHGDNPYFGMLAWADYIIVTADSVSMLSEAATTGKPVYMVKLEGGTKRFDNFHRIMAGFDLVRAFDGTLTPYNYDAPQVSALIAAEIRQRLGKS